MPLTVTAEPILSIVLTADIEVAVDVNLILVGAGNFNV